METLNTSVFLILCIFRGTTISQMPHTGDCPPRTALHTIDARKVSILSSRKEGKIISFISSYLEEFGMKIRGQPASWSGHINASLLKFSPSTSIKVHLRSRPFTDCKKKYNSNYSNSSIFYLEYLCILFV